jgi:hypothetical protein
MLRARQRDGILHRFLRDGNFFIWRAPGVCGGAAPIVNKVPPDAGPELGGGVPDAPNAKGAPPLAGRPALVGAGEAG